MNKVDIENQIMKVWNVVDDMEALANYITDGEEPMTEDEIFNALNGLKIMLNIKCENLFNTYEKWLKESRDDKKESTFPFSFDKRFGE